MKAKIIKLILFLRSHLSINALLSSYYFRNRNKKLSNLSTQLIDKAYHFEKEIIHECIAQIIELNEDQVLSIKEIERTLPGSEENLKTGYHSTMLKRYVFAGSYFSQDLNVLDSCSGLGWGTYILSQYASQITAFDISNESLEFSRKNWKGEHIEWLCSDALKPDNIKNEYYDVAVAMETIEHFTKMDGEKYMLNLRDKLKKGGLLIGSSTFPFSRNKANKACSTNPYHLYVHTYFEFSRFLKANFKEYRIIDNWMFIARK